MKVTIVGGGGRVGSCAAFALQLGGVVSEVQLVDVNVAAAEGEALDLLHGSSLVSDVRVYAGDYGRASDSDVFVITAGLRRRPDESRLDLVGRNVRLFLEILDGVKGCGCGDGLRVLVVSNPVDVLTRLAVERLGLGRGRVMGLGTMLDTARFSSLIADGLGLAATQVRALVLGEHGDSMVPVWSGASVNGLPLSGLAGCDAGFQGEVFRRMRGSGAEVIERKGGAGWAVGAAIVEVVHSMVLDEGRLLPVSVAVDGVYGLGGGVCLSVPCVVGRGGVVEQVEAGLWPKERMGLQGSARALDGFWGRVGEVAGL